jgi:hypothetical protein
MTTVMQRDNTSFLRNTLKGNAIFSIISGGAFALGSSVLAPFMGMDNPLLLLVLGIGVVIFGASVWRIANGSLNAQQGIAIMVLDVIWVLGSILLLIADPFTFTNEGKWAVLIVADIVGVFAILEYLGVRRLR